MKTRILLMAAALSLSSTAALAQQSTQQMPGGRGEMADHPHAQRGPGSTRPMTHERSNMPAGQGEMPDHPHAAPGGQPRQQADLSRTDMSKRVGDMPNYPFN